MIELTQTQLQALKQDTESPPRVVDPETSTAYVLVRADVYDRMRAVLEDADPEAMYPLLAELSPEDWEDASAYGIPPKS